MDYKSEVEDDEGYLNEQKGEDEEKKEADLNDDSELGEEKEETKWDDIDWSEDNYNEREKTKWDDIDWSEDNNNEREKTKWDEIDWNEDIHGDRDKNEKDKNDGQNEEYNKEDYVENVESQSTSTVLTNKIEEIEGDMEHQEQEEEIEIRPEEYKDDTEPIVNTDEIEFIKDVEELAEHAREIKTEDEIVELQAEQENAAYYAEQYYEKLKEKVVVKDQDSIKEQETEELRQEVAEEFKSEESINEASKEITSPEEFEYLWGIREKLDREGKSTEEIEEVMHEAEEMYETLKNAEKLYEEQELEKLKLVDHEDEASVEDLKEDLDRIDLVEQAVELEEVLVQQGMSQEEIDTNVEEAIETTKFEEKLEVIIEKRKLEKLKLIDHEDEASEEDIKENLDRIDLVEQAVELEEVLVQQGMSQEEIDTRVEEAIEPTKFEEKLETIIEKEQESIVNKKLKKHDLEINEQNSNENIDNEENLEVLKPELDAIESESEANKDFLEESTKLVSEESDEEESEHLQELYRQETGRRPIYARQKTKGYSQWLEQRELRSEKIKNSKSESEKIKEIEEEGWKTTLKQWIKEVSEEECNAELKSELKIALESYNKFEDLTRKFLELCEKSQYEKLSEKEKNRLKSLTERLQGLGPIQLELLANIRAFKDYFYNHLWELMNRFFVIRVRSKFFKHILQKYKFLKQEMLKLKELINDKGDIVQKPRVCVSNKLALTDYNLDDYCRIVVNYIKNKIGIDHNNFDKFFEILREKKVNILRDVLSDTTILNFMKIGNIDTSKKRNFDQAKKCCQVIALALNCSNYKCLFSKFKDVSGLQDRQTRALIKKYIPLLNSINPKLDIEIWMPKKKSPLYTFGKIKQIVERAGKQRTGKNGILLNPKNSEEFEDLKRKYKKRASQLPLRVKCGRCDYEWNTTISNIVQSKTKTYSWCTNCIKPEYYSFNNIKHKVYETIIKFIKNEIGANHNRFDEFIRHIEEKKIDSNIFLKKMLSNQILKEIINEVKMNKYKKAHSQIERCVHVVSLALIKSKNYNELLEDLSKIYDSSRNALVKMIVKYITHLGEIYEFNVSKWLPKKKQSAYTLPDILNYVTDKGWILISPKDQNEFNILKEKKSPNNIPLILHCGNPEHLEWSTRFRTIKHNKTNCPDCSNNIVTYSRIKQIVKKLGIEISGRDGILIHPESNESFMQIRRENRTQPSYITLIVSCEKQKHQSWKTNAVNLSQGKWCRECYLERNTKYDFDTIKSLVESKGGTLIYPASQEEYEKLLNRLKNMKSKHNSPSDLPIKVSCNKGHRPFSTTPDNVAQNHWCPLCGERYSVVGTLIHPIFEFLFLRLFLLKKCNAKYEKKIISDKKRLVDILVERDKNFIDKIENKQHTLIVPDFINFLIIDFTIGRNLRNIIDHCERGYQSNDRLLIIVLLRFRNQKDKNEIVRIQEVIYNNPNIDNNRNIRLFTSDQFLDFLNLRINLTKWNSSKDEIKMLKEEIKIVHEYERILEFIEDVLSSDLRFDGLVNYLSELSDFYKKKLLEF